jgi:hypothetical protein
MNECYAEKISLCNYSAQVNLKGDRRVGGWDVKFSQRRRCRCWSSEDEGSLFVEMFLSTRKFTRRSNPEDRLRNPCINAPADNM